MQKIENSMNNRSSEFTGLKSSIKKQETELQNVKEALKIALESNKNLRTELLKVTKERKKEQKQQIDELYDSIDAQEQYSRKNSIEILGILENVYENEKAVLKMGRL